MKHNIRRFLFLAGTDLAILLVCLTVTLIIRQYFSIHLELLKEHILAFLPLFVMWQITFYGEGLYDMGARQDIVYQLSEIMVAAGINGAVGITYFYLLTPYLGITPKTHLLVALLLSHILILAWRRYCWILFGSGHFSQRAAICADEPIVFDLANEMRINPMLGLVPVMGTLDKVNLIIVDKRWIDKHESEARVVMAASIHNKVPIISLERFYERFLDKIAPEHISDHSHWMLENVLPQMMGTYFIVKRFTDIVLSTVLLILSFPLLALIALLIRIIDRHNVFFLQERVGYLGKKFNLLKLRTMNCSASPKPFSSLHEVDSRVTWIGRWLRRFRLDELPQFWNVIKGDMSLVGPRPEWTQEVKVIEQRLPHYHLRHLVRPGITGWAQLHFRATNNIDDSLEKMRYDLYYIKHISLAVDLGILLKTLKRVVIRDTDIGRSASRISAASELTSSRSPLTVDIHNLFSYK